MRILVWRGRARRRCRALQQRYREVEDLATPRAARADTRLAAAPAAATLRVIP